MELIEEIDKRIGEVRTESLDISVGEITALHEQGELIIQPDFQRLFRWSFEQRSRLIESLLLELPIPSIFLIEKESGVLELIDGLQRISSVLHFLSAETMSLQSEPLRLEGCDLIQMLNGMTFNDLPLTLRLRLKRTPIRTVIIKRQSSQFLRYEMFKRLNTGGSKLSEQDIRNVNARMLGDKGAEFYSLLTKCANFPAFKETIELLPLSALETRADEELVLRFFAAKNFRREFRGSIGDWLDNYMEAILLKNQLFGQTDVQEFEDTFTLIAEKLGQHAFVKYRGGQPLGGVAPAYFEAVSIATDMNRGVLAKLSAGEAKKAVAAAVESEEFRRVTGPGANSLPKLEQRIAIIAQAFQKA